MLTEEEIAERRAGALPIFVFYNNLGIPTGMVKTTTPTHFYDAEGCIQVDENFDFDRDSINVETGEVIKNDRELPPPVPAVPPVSR